MKTKVYINTQIEDFDFEKEWHLISEQRRQQALLIHQLESRKLSVMAYRLLQEALETEYNIYDQPVFDYPKGGKPILRDYPNIFFNMSHCRGGVACVVGNSPLGVDIETIRPFKSNLACYIFNDEDYSQIITSEHPNETFVKLWTVREAIGKWSGKGLNGSMKQPIKMRDEDKGWEVKSLVLPTCFSGCLDFDRFDSLAKAASAKRFEDSEKLYLSVCHSLK